MGYREVYDRWRNDPDSHWMEAARAIAWVRPPTRAFDPGAGVYGRWFPDAICNTCFNALDRHVAAGRGAQRAIIHDSPVTGTVSSLTYAELLREVQALALVLTDAGVGKGDRVVIYMPMVPEAVVGMLACARIGAIHSVVFGGFAARELAARIDDAAPKVILAASCGFEPGRTVAYMPLLDEALRQAEHRPDLCLILQREGLVGELTAGRDADWHERLQAGLAALDGGRDSPCVELAATDPLYILYTSGTTGKPKGVVRDNGGHMVMLAWTMNAIYGLSPGDVFWTASDVGWVVGHSYIVYGPLLHGCTSVLYEGKPVGTPDAGAFWRVAAQHRVNALFTAPTAIRAIRARDPEGDLLAGRDLSCLRTVFLAGERADPETVKWVKDRLGVPVVDHWWQTETGSPVAANPRGLDDLAVKPGSPTVPMPGYGLRVLDDEGRPVEAGTMGNIVIDLPLPPGAAVTLWQADERFRESYLAARPGFYDTADAGMLDEDGYVWVMGRTDDVVNVAGHRLSTGAIEEAVASHPAVAECAVFGLRDDVKGEVPVGLVVLKAGAEGAPGTIEGEVVAAVRERIGPVAAFRKVVVVERLPKTRSGKILRATMKKIAVGDPYTVPGTIEDAAVLGEIERVLASL